MNFIQTDMILCDKNLIHVTFISNEKHKKLKYVKSFPLNQPKVDPIVKLKTHRVYNRFYFIE